jgi:diadenosine tetraphosphate (Ap4A) HIT family hydrolase
VNKDCLICLRITQIKKGTSSYFVRELKTGYVVIGDYQFFKGYTLFLCKKHVSELHELDRDFKNEFLNEMSVVAKAVFRAFGPQKLNYELLGNAEPHLHWHIFPRYKNDPLPNKPVWNIDKNIRCDDKFIPKPKELEELKSVLTEVLKKEIPQ